MTTFDRYNGPAGPIRSALLELEVFIGDLDGAEIDDGTVDAEDAVKAFNVIVAALNPAERGSKEGG